MGPNCPVVGVVESMYEMMGGVGADEGVDEGAEEAAIDGTEGDIIPGAVGLKDEGGTPDAEVGIADAMPLGVGLGRGA